MTHYAPETYRYAVEFIQHRGEHGPLTRYPMRLIPTSRQEEVTRTNARMGVNFADLLSDRCKPLFWFFATRNLRMERNVRLLPYRREMAKESIQSFCEEFHIPKAQWKWLCNQEDQYLHAYFYRMGDFFNIRLPFEYFYDIPQTGGGYCEIGSNGRQRAVWRNDLPSPGDFYDSPDTTIETYRPYADELRERLLRFITETLQDGRNDREKFFQCINRCYENKTLPDGPTFSQIIIDLADVLYNRHYRQENMADDVGGKIRNSYKHICAAPNWNEFVSRIRFAEQRLNRYITRQETVRWPANIGWHTGNSPLAGNKPINPVKENYDWLEKLPKEIDGDKGYRARLLSDEMEIRAEGAAMRHCLGNMYRSKIASGAYVAYHIDIPKDKHGATLGLNAAITRHKDEKENKIVYEVKWSLDQIRGYQNHIFGTNRLLENLTQKIIKEVNTTAGQSASIDPELFDENGKLKSVDAENELARLLADQMIGQMNESIIRTLVRSREQYNQDSLSFSDNGQRMYVADTAGDQIHEYNLSIPHDVSSAEWHRARAVSMQREEIVGDTVRRQTIAFEPRYRNNDERAVFPVRATTS